MLVLLELEGKWRRHIEIADQKHRATKAYTHRSEWWCLIPFPAQGRCRMMSHLLCVSIRIPQNLLFLCPVLSLFVLSCCLWHFLVWGYVIPLSVQRC